jgi:hypothetical protein
MATSTGTVTDLKVRLDGVIDLAMVTLLDSETQVPEQFVLWFGRIGKFTPFSVWIARSLVVSMLKDALVNKLSVSLTHEDTSSLIDFVELLGA